MADNEMQTPDYSKCEVIGELKIKVNKNKIDILYFNYEEQETFRHHEEVEGYTFKKRKLMRHLFAPSNKPRDELFKGIVENVVVFCDCAENNRDFPVNRNVVVHSCNPPLKCFMVI